MLFILLGLLNTRSKSDLSLHDHHLKQYWYKEHPNKFLWNKYSYFAREKQSQLNILVIFLVYSNKDAASKLQ